MNSAFITKKTNVCIHYTDKQSIQNARVPNAFLFIQREFVCLCESNSRTLFRCCVHIQLNSISWFTAAHRVTSYTVSRSLSVKCFTCIFFYLHPEITAIQIILKKKNKAISRIIYFWCCCCRQKKRLSHKQPFGFDFSSVAYLQNTLWVLRALCNLALIKWFINKSSSPCSLKIDYNLLCEQTHFVYTQNAIET